MSSRLPLELPAKNLNLESHVGFDPLSLIDNFRLPVTGLFHVGANDGDSAPLYKALSHVPVFAVEPLSEAFKLLENNISGLTNVKVLNSAIGKTSGFWEINVASNGGQSSSFLEPGLHLQLAPGVQFGKKERVRVERIDSLGLEHNFNFWVIDTQGTELEVLQSAGCGIEIADFIYCEVNRGETYKNCTRVQELDSYLEKHGFSRRLTRWFTIWGDALYVKGSSSVA